MAESSNTDNQFAIREYHGRYKITLPMTKEEFESEGTSKTISRIIDALPYVMTAHNKNAQAIDYLFNYYKGKQPILNKKKVVREDINHIVVENHAFEIVEFKNHSYMEIQFNISKKVIRIQSRYLKRFLH